MAKQTLEKKDQPEVKEVVIEEPVKEVVKTNADVVKGIKGLAELMKEVGENLRKEGKPNRRHVAWSVKLNALISRRIFA